MSIHVVIILQSLDGLSNLHACMCNVYMRAMMYVDLFYMRYEHKIYYYSHFIYLCFHGCVLWLSARMFAQMLNYKYLCNILNLNIFYVCSKSSFRNDVNYEMWFLNPIPKFNKLLFYIEVSLLPLNDGRHKWMTPKDNAKIN